MRCFHRLCAVCVLSGIGADLLPMTAGINRIPPSNSPTIPTAIPLSTALSSDLGCLQELALEKSFKVVKSAKKKPQQPPWSLRSD